jgi:Dynamin family.
MSQGLEKLSEAKTVLKEIVETAYNDKLITEEERTKLSIEDLKFRIGIVGQIKAGKSTLINTLIFKKQVMPVASTPMTATLCYITYGEQPKIEVEFYSKDEWEFIENEAKRSDKNTAYARELVEKASLIKEELWSLLGSIKTISFDELYDYVGEDGRYVPIVKLLKVYYPSNVLKDVEIVDTPGINDPVESREKKTREFLNESDVVIFLTYAGRPFDAIDIDLLRRLMSVGIGKVVFVLNKIDTILEEEGNIEKAISRIKNLIHDELVKAKRQNYKFIEDVLSAAKNKIIPLSSLWALLGVLDMKEIEKDEDLSYHYYRTKENFPHIQSQTDFYKNSGLQELINEIFQIIENEKLEIILQKHVTNILNKYKEKINDLKNEINRCEYSLKDLDMNIELLNKELETFKIVKYKILELVLQTQWRIKKYLYDKRDRIPIETNHIIQKFYEKVQEKFPKKGVLSRSSTYEEQVEQHLYTHIQDLKIEIEKKIIEHKNELMEYIENNLSNLKDRAIEEAQTLTFTQEQYYKLLNSFLDTLHDKLNISFNVDFDINLSNLTGGLLSIITGLRRFEQEALSQIRNKLNELQTSLENKIKYAFDELIKVFSDLQDDMIYKVLDPIENRIYYAKSNIENKEKEKEELNSKIERLKIQIEHFNKNYEKIKERAEYVRKIFKGGYNKS